MGQWARSSERSILLLLLLIGAAWAPRASAAVPDWLRQAAAETLPKYPDDTSAVVLLDEQVTTVNENGEITTLYRRAYRILRSEERRVGKECRL